jgi:hypothetical protein
MCEAFEHHCGVRFAANGFSPITPPSVAPQPALKPPSTVSVVPLIIAASSLSKKAMVEAISPG